ncbi:MAG: NFACT family protein, partial [Candidatus Nanoarchaeia archaeon]
MKNLTALELHYLLKEFRILINAKLDKIYHPSKKELILQFHITNIGQKLLRIVVPNAIYFATAKQEAKEPSQFCAFLRKNLTNSKLIEIKQLGFERILEFVFQTKEKKFSLIFEFFSKGNIILTKENQIILALEYQKWAERTIRPKEIYKYPKKEYDFLTATMEGLKEFLKKTKKESIVTALAIELGLGGTYAEECCILSEINKTKKPAELSENEINRLFNAFQQLKTKKLNPKIIRKDAEIIDIVPFELQIYKNLEQ